jgi:hypothetical protein
MTMRSVLPLLLLVPVMMQAGDFSKVGTSAAQFLKIGAGSRGAAMGDAFVAVATGVDALAWNPSGIAGTGSVAVAASHAKWFADISHNFAGLVVPLGDDQALGLSVIQLGAPEQEVTTIDKPDGAGVYYDVSDLALGLTYARRLTNRFSVGVTAKYIQQTAFNESANAFAVDIGTTLETGFHGLVIGMSLANFGSNMRLEGRDLLSVSNPSAAIAAGAYGPNSHLTTEEWPLPLYFRIGVAMDVVGGRDPFVVSDQHRVTIALAGDHPNDNVERGSVGAEYGWSETLFLRAGYKINYDVEKWTFGAGVAVAPGEQKVTFDFALVDYGDLGKTSRFTVGVQF